MQQLNSLQDLLLHEVQDLYSAEKQLVKALPKVAKKASSSQLKHAIEDHCRQTEEHVHRLEQVFEMLDAPAKTSRCKAMAGILEEGEDDLEHNGSEETLDAAIIAAAQKVEHYEIAGYGSAAAWAAMLGLHDIKSLLGKTLAEEEATDGKLTKLAMAAVNRQSASKEPAGHFAA